MSIDFLHIKQLYFAKGLSISVIKQNMLPSNLYIRRNLVGNKVVHHSDVVGAFGAAPITSSFSA